MTAKSPYDTVSWKSRAAVIALTVIAVVAVGSAAQAAVTTVSSPNEIPGNNYLAGVDATDASNVWAVGVVIPPLGGTHRPLVFRYNGTAWGSIPRTGLPSGTGLNGVDAIAANDVWVAGNSPAGFLRDDTMVARWNGTTWTRESTPNGSPGGTNGLDDVAAAGATVWAVGSYLEPNSSTRRKLILQRAGGTWRVSAAPARAAWERLAAVDATGPADAWAVGWATNDIRSTQAIPLALRWNGSGWASMTLPGPGSVLNGVDARTPSDVWAVGYAPTGTGRQPYVARFDGTSWRQVATPSIAGELTDVVALSPSNVVAVGRASGAALVLRWNGTAWTRETTPVLAGPYLTGAAAAGPTSVWAVGYRFELNAYANRTLTMLMT
jgi:hypothetical protein